MTEFYFEDFGDWEATKTTLHAYVRVIAAVPRRWRQPHSKWWHIGLQVSPAGLATRPVPLPGGGEALLRIDANRHCVVVEAAETEVLAIPMDTRRTASELSELVFESLSSFGLSDSHDSTKFKNESPRFYDPAVGRLYFRQIAQIDRLLKKHRATLTGDLSPVQLWPHGFDITLEWFGHRRVSMTEDGQATEHATQLSLGWSPGEPNHPEPYFFSNPWPFDEALLKAALPVGARWFTDGWLGSIFPYRALVGDPDAEMRVLDFARRVFELTEPTLN